MVALPVFPDQGRRGWLAGILLLAVLVRLPQITVPLADNLQIKQVYVSNKARSIARPPLNPLRNTLDFLDDRGERLALTEEVPLYTGVLGAGYRLLGEHDWIGRILSLLGTLVAIAAYAGMTRRELGPAIGYTGAFLLSVAPLLVFYGRAVLPDPWMLAAMLTAAWCYRMFLDDPGPGWLIAAAFAAALAPLCKYYGVMILIPLAGMTWSRGEQRLRRWQPFLIMCIATLLPVGLWIGSIFLRTANPVVSGWSGDGKALPYLVFQAPRVLLSSAFYSGFLLRFLGRDCGPVMSALAVFGIVAAVRRRREASSDQPGMLQRWHCGGSPFIRSSLRLFPPLVKGGFGGVGVALPGAIESVPSTRSLLLVLDAQSVAGSSGLTPPTPPWQGGENDCSVLRLLDDAPQKPLSRHLISRTINPTISSPHDRPALQPLICWSAMGSAFYVLFAPKLIDHDYYELMLLPAVATWGAIGLCRLIDRASALGASRAGLVLVLLALALAVQLPLCTAGMFRVDQGKLIVAERLKAWSDAGQRIVVIGPGIELATIIHYSGREGWALTRMQRLPDQWPARIESLRAAGAQALAIYFEPKAKARARESLEELAQSLPILERGTGPWSRIDGRCSYWILDLRRELSR